MEISQDTAIPSELASSHILDDQSCHEISGPSSTSVKSVGSVENFWWSYAVVRKVLFNYCLQVMWNAVFFDPLTEYLFSWRKRKLWSQPKPQPSVNGCKDYGEKIEQYEVPDRDYHPQLDSSPSSLKSGNILEGQMISHTYNSKDLTCIIEGVENELHFSSKMSLADYIRSFVEKEVNTLIPSPEEDKLSQVSLI